LDLSRFLPPREIIRRATDNAVDILGAPEFQNLKAAVTATPLWYEAIQVPADEPVLARHDEAPDLGFGSLPLQ
jgi:hypothetical protein